MQEVHPPETARKRILIIEDQAQAARYYIQALQALPVDVEVVEDGRAGLSRARAGGLDALIVDYHLPGMDGLALITALREAGHAPVPTFVISGGVAPQLLQDAKAIGVTAWLIKPIRLPILRKALQNTLDLP